VGLLVSASRRVPSRFRAVAPDHHRHPRPPPPGGAVFGFGL